MVALAQEKTIHPGNGGDATSITQVGSKSRGLILTKRSGHIEYPTGVGEEWIRRLHMVE